MEKKWRKTAFCTRLVSFVSVASVFLAIERRKKAYFEVKQTKNIFECPYIYDFHQELGERVQCRLKILLHSVTLIPFVRPSLAKQTLVNPTNLKIQRLKLEKNNIFDWRIKRAKGEKKYIY